MAASLVDVPERGEKLWGETARSLLTGMMGYVLESATMEGRRNMRSVLHLFSPGSDLAAVFATILTTEPDLNPFIREVFREAHRKRSQAPQIL